MFIAYLVVAFVMPSGVCITDIFNKISVYFLKSFVGGDNREEPAAPGKVLFVSRSKEFAIKCPYKVSSAVPCLHLRRYMAAALRFILAFILSIDACERSISPL